MSSYAFVIFITLTNWTAPVTLKFETAAECQSARDSFIENKTGRIAGVTECAIHLEAAE